MATSYWQPSGGPDEQISGFGPYFTTGTWFKLSKDTLVTHLGGKFGASSSNVQLCWRIYRVWDGAKVANIEQVNATQGGWIWWALGTPVTLQANVEYKLCLYNASGLNYSQHNELNGDAGDFTDSTSLSGVTITYREQRYYSQEGQDINPTGGPLSNNIPLFGFGATVNTAPNAPTITSPTAGQYVNTRTPTITWTFSDPDAGDSQYAFNIQTVDPAYSYVIWDSGWIVGSQKSYTLPSGAYTMDGNVYVRMKVQDSSGVINTANGSGPDISFQNQRFWIDTVAPTGSRADAQTRYLNASNKTSVTFTVNASDNLLLNNVQFPTWGDSGGQNDINWYNGTNNGNGTWSKTVNFNSHDGGIDQHYNIHVYAYDQAGSSANIAVYDVYVDTVAPAAPTQTNGVLYATSNGVSWSAFNDPAPSSGLLLTTMNLQSWNGSTWVNVATYPKSVTGLTHSFTGLTPATQYRWGVTYTDNSSNVSTLNYTTFTTNTYPVTTITNLTSNGYLFDKTPRIKFTVTDANDATLTNFQVQFATDAAFTQNVGVLESASTPAYFSASSAPSGSTIYFTSPADAPVTGLWYIRARAYDGKDWGPFSTVSFTIQAISWATTVAANDTTVSKRTIDEIRTKVNAVRQARGLAVANWTDPTIVDWNGGIPTLIKITHLIELRQAIVDIYTALSVTAPTWSDNIIDSTVDREGTHWIELRSFLQAV